MFYPKSEFCPFNPDEPKREIYNSSIAESENEINRFDEMTNNNSSSQCEMLRRIQEIDFAIIDLNLFLDTHPNCNEALELFTKLSATSKSLKHDYQSKYGPLYVTKSADKTPFEWVDKCYKWPWEM